MPGTHRLFIGLKPNAVFHNELKQVLKRLQPFGIKTTRPENLHMTLCFIGNVDEETYHKITEQFIRFPSPSSLQMEFQEVHLFPPAQPRMVWASFAADENAAQLYYNLQETFLDKKPRKFLPHFTLSRFKHKPDGLHNIKLTKMKLPDFKPVELALWRSFLAGSGPEYRLLVSKKM